MFNDTPQHDKNDVCALLNQTFPHGRFNKQGSSPGELGLWTSLHYNFSFIMRIHEESCVPGKVNIFKEMSEHVINTEEKITPNTLENIWQ